MRDWTKKLIAVGLVISSFAVFDYPVALWASGSVILFGFAVGDILDRRSE